MNGIKAAIERISRMRKESGLHVEAINVSDESIRRAMK